MNSVDYSIHPEKTSLLLLLSQTNIIPKCILNMYLLFSEINVALTSHLLLFQQMKNITDIHNWSKFKQLTTGCPVPNHVSIMQTTLTWKMGVGKIPRAGKLRCLLLVPSRHGKNAAPMKSQQYGSLRKGHIMIRPGEMPKWIEETWQFPTTRWRATDSQWSLREENWVFYRV